MNWSADIAGQVVARLDDEWRDLVAEYHPEVHTETRVTALRATADGRLILASEHWESDPCDVVVVAVGFGVEPPASGLSLDSYWENDKLEQSVRGAQPLKRYLVSGLGDGACIDVLRLTYANFDHGRFAMAIARLNDLQRLKRPLVGIDLRMPDTGQVEYLRTQYERLSFPPNLATQLGTFRTDTYVLLNGPDPAPLSPRACILHRVAIWSLVLASKLVYRPGRLDVGGIEPRSVSTGLRYLVPLPGVGGKNAFDGVIIRHGPIACLGALPAIATAYRAIRENPAKDRTRTKRYPDGFYPEPRSRRPTGDGQPPSVARALAGDVWFKDTLTPHLACGASAGVIEAPGLRAALAVPPSSAIAEVQALIQTLKEETRAQNFPEASEAAGLLEGLIMRHGGSLGRQTWDAANTALWDCELLVRERVMAGGGTYDMGRLRELVERIEHGHP
jgi:hypothetical protein